MELINQAIYDKLIRILGDEKVVIAEPMRKHTSFRIGGPADYYVLPENKEELREVITACIEENIPYFILGNGSNLLVGDLGYRGVIIQLSTAFSEVTLNKGEEGHCEVIAGAGILLSKLAMTVAKEGLTGFEFAAGIPGTLGGAVAMNAGAYGGQIKDHLLCARIIDREGKEEVLTNEELELSYRNSLVLKKEAVVLEAAFLFEYGDKDTILEKVTNLNRQRKEKQPLELASAGSTFKRPDPRDGEVLYAGKLIMDSGLRGYRVGNVCVSEKHCGFVVNLGDGTAKEVKQLIEDVIRIVEEKYQVTLEPEVRFIGEFEA